MPTLDTPILELDYKTYQDRQKFEVSPEGIELRMQKLAKGGRAEWVSNKWIPQPYPGFSMQAMVSSSAENGALSIDLAEIQRRSINLIERPGVLYPLPQASFHQTVANTFSSKRLERRIIRAGLLEQFPTIISSALEDLPVNDHSAPLVMRLIGISVFRTAFGLLGVFDSRLDFERVITFRNRFYSHPDLKEIGLSRTRPFIGHITLGYIEDLPTEEESEQFKEGISQINREIASMNLHFHMPVAELHRYDTLAEFIPDSSYPKHTL